MVAAPRPLWTGERDAHRMPYRYLPLIIEGRAADWLNAAGPTA